MPVAAAVVASATFLGSGWVRGLARDIATGRAGAASFGVLAFIASRMALPRVLDAAGGWLRHLPASDRAHRRAVVLALAMALAPLWIAGLVLGLIAWPDAPLASTRLLAAIPLETLAGATLALASRMRVEASLLTGAAALLGALPYAGALATAWGMLLLGDLVGGTLDPPRTAQSTRGANALAWLDARFAWRALRPRLAEAMVLALLPLLAGLLFAINNVLSNTIVDGAGRLAGVLAVTVQLSVLGDALATRRPAWPWRRSLPESALHRVATDASLLAIATLPVLALVLALFPASAAAVAGTLPFLAARASHGMRVGALRKTGTGGEILMEGILTALAITLLPRLAWGLLAAVPAALALAARADQRDRVSTFRELHHQQVGDSAEWRS